MRSRQLLTSAAFVAVVFVALPLLGSTQPDPTVLYVDDDAPLGGDGLSWESAYRFLQDALAVAVAGNDIRVAQGTYQPDQDEAGNFTPGDREATFQLVNGVALMGGYRGLTRAGDPNERNVQLYPTVLTGSIGDPDAFFDNSYHVTTGSRTDETAVLDGFTVTRGAASELMAPHGRGAGLFIVAGSPQITHCTFTENYAELAGGAIANEGGSPSLVDCDFIINWADDDGAALWSTRGQITASACTFASNEAFDGDGGAIHATSSIVSITDCVFTANAADRRGGAIWQTGGTMQLSNCTFADNYTHGGGGAIYANQALLTIESSSFSGNDIHHARGGGLYVRECNIDVTDCEFVDQHGFGNSIGGRDRLLPRIAEPNYC